MGWDEVVGGYLFERGYKKFIFPQIRYLYVDTRVFLRKPVATAVTKFCMISSPS